MHSSLNSPFALLLRRLFSSILIGVAVVSLLFSFYSDLSIVWHSPMSHPTGIRSILIPIVLTFLESVLPLVFVFGLYKQIRLRNLGTTSGAKLYRTLYIMFKDGLSGLWLFITLCLSIVSFLLDTYFAFSVAPFTVSVCGGIWIVIGLWLLKPIQLDRKLVMLAVSLLLVLAFSHFDWNSRRPFLRDLLKIRSGMTTEQVDQIMGRYIKGTGLQSPEEGNIELEIQDSVVYRHATKGPFFSDWGLVRFNNGRVEAVAFQAD